VPREDGGDGLALRRGRREEGRGGNAVAETQQGAGGLEGGQPVAVGVQRAEVRNLLLQFGASTNVALGCGAYERYEKRRRKVRHTRDQTVGPLEKTRRRKVLVPLKHPEVRPPFLDGEESLERFEVTR
jgi:hypothetical protein